MSSGNSLSLKTRTGPGCKVILRRIYHTRLIGPHSFGVGVVCWRPPPPRESSPLTNLYFRHFALLPKCLLNSFIPHLVGRVISSVASFPNSCFVSFLSFFFSDPSTVIRSWPPRLFYTHTPRSIKFTFRFPPNLHFIILFLCVIYFFSVVCMYTSIVTLMKYILGPL